MTSGGEFADGTCWIKQITPESARDIQIGSYAQLEWAKAESEEAESEEAESEEAESEEAESEEAESEEAESEEAESEEAESEEAESEEAERNSVEERHGTHPGDEVLEEDNPSRRRSLEDEFRSWSVAVREPRWIYPVHQICRLLFSMREV